MDVLWTPWRYDYIKGNSPATMGCVFCELLNDPATDEEKFILKRAGYNFVILNIYPYTSGHVMVVPYDHIPTLDRAGKAVTDEMMDLIKSSQAAITEVYTPDGINIGMNLGKAAGAGVEEHFHMHVLPRWVGDVNFMTAVGQTRTLPETLRDSYQRLRAQM